MCPAMSTAALTGRGIPVSCEVDIYGALSRVHRPSASPARRVTLLDINNTVPQRRCTKHIQEQYRLGRLNEAFMGFHCGNTCKERLVNAEMKYQLIMNRNLENCGEPVITRGTHRGSHRAVRHYAASVCRAMPGAYCAAMWQRASVLPMWIRARLVRHRRHRHSGNAHGSIAMCW